MRHRHLTITVAALLALTGCAGLGDAIDTTTAAALARCEGDLDDCREDRSAAREELEEETKLRMGAEQRADGLQEDLDWCGAQLAACRVDCRPGDDCPPPVECDSCCPDAPPGDECPDPACDSCCPEPDCPPGEEPSELDLAMERYERWRVAHSGDERCGMWAHTGGKCGVTCWRVAVGDGQTAEGKAPDFADAVNEALDEAVRKGCAE